MKDTTSIDRRGEHFYVRFHNRGRYPGRPTYRAWSDAIADAFAPGARCQIGRLAGPSPARYEVYMVRVPTAAVDGHPSRAEKVARRIRDQVARRRADVVA